MITNDGKIYIFSGKARSGKSAKAALLEKALKYKTVFAWDPEAQWCDQPGFKKITSIIQLREIVKAGKVGKYAFVCNGDLRAGFEKMCACVFHWGMFFGPALYIAEELSDVTSTAKAGPYWGMLIRRVLKRGVSVFAISQRWQESDKTAIGNYSEAFIFKPTPRDESYVAAVFGLPLQEVVSLRQFEFIHCLDYGEAERGFLPFAKPKK